MINTELESLVQIAMAAFVESFADADEYKQRMFELEFRKMLMQKYCNGVGKNTAHTYTITPGTATGKWTTRAGLTWPLVPQCPPSTSTGTILHG